MTVYGHQGAAADGGRGGTRVDAGPGRGLREGALYGVVSAAVAASWAFVAMAAVTALSVHLLGLDTYTKLDSATAAMVAMAVGGRISPTGNVSVFGMDAAQAQGAIGIIPLGVSLVGALVLGQLFVRPLRRLPVLQPGVLLARAAGAVGAFLILLGVVGWAGDGAVAVNVGSLAKGGTGGTGGGGLGGLLGDGGTGGGGDPLGGLGGALGGLVGDNSASTVGFKVDLVPTLGLGLLWVLVVLAIAVLASRRCPLPVGWEALARTVRPVLSALVTVLVGAVLVGALAGIVVGLTGNGGTKTVGGTLLAAPNGVFLAVLLGMAIPLSGKASGPLAGFLPSPVDKLLAGGNGKDITLSGLAGFDGRVWLLPVAVGLMLLAVGVFAAVRTPRPVLPRSGVAEAGGAGLRLGVALAVATPVLLVLAQVSVGANLSVFGFDAVSAGLSISGNLLLGAVLGLVEGAVFGFLGALLVARFASAKRVPLPAAGGGFATPARPGTGQSWPQTPPPPVPPQRPSSSGYGGLPQSPAPGRAPVPDNPYRGGPPATPPQQGPPQQGPPQQGGGQQGGGYNPYSGGPSQGPPPPPVPPGR